MRGERRCCFGFMVTKPDYYIVTFETDRRPFSWRWEIRRHSQPMGVKLGAGGYPSQAQQSPPVFGRTVQGRAPLSLIAAMPPDASSLK